LQSYCKKYKLSGLLFICILLVSLLFAGTVFAQPEITGITHNAADNKADVGDTVTWTVTHARGVSFAFYVYKDGSRVHTQWWSTSPSVAYEFLSVGTYSVRAFVRDAADKMVWDDSSPSINVTVTAGTWKPLAISENDILVPALPANVGDSQTWTVTDEYLGGSEPYEYAFYVYEGSDRVLARWWDGSNTVAYTPTEPDPTEYWVRAFVRDDTGAMVWADSAKVQFTGTMPDPLSIDSFGLPEGKPVGEVNGPKTWSVTAKGGTETYEYAFYVYEGSSRVLTLWWGGSNTVDYIPMRPDTDYWVRAFVRDGDAMVWDDSDKVQFAGDEKLPFGIAAVTTTPKDGGYLWEVVMNEGHEDGNEYAYYLYRDGARIYTIWWGVDDETFEYKPITSGMYKVRAFARNALGTMDWKDSDESAYVAVTGVSIVEEDQTIESGDTLQLSATVVPEDATFKGVSWESDAVAVATVDQDGLVTGVGAGEAEITVTTDDGGFTDTVTITVEAVAVEPDMVVSDGQSIQAALDTAQPGDWIHVEAGLYEENLIIDKAIKLTGDGRDDTIVQAVLGRNYDGAPMHTPVVMITGNAALLNQQPLQINSPAGLAGNKNGTLAAFGPAPGDPAWNVSGNVVLAEPILADVPLTNPVVVSGKIALIDRGAVDFSLKVYYAQQAGAIAVIIANTDDNPITMAAGSFADEITIPSAMIKKSDADAIKAELAAEETVNASFREDVYDVDGEGITISGFTFQGRIPEANPGDPTGVFDGWGNTGINGLSTHGILSFDMNNVWPPQSRQNITVTDNKFVFCGGVSLYNVTGFEIRNNIMVRESHQIPYYVDDQRYHDKAVGGRIAYINSCRNGLIKNNEGYDPKDTGVIVMYSSTNVDIINNIIEAPETSLAGDDGYSYAGISVGGSLYVNVIGNTVKGFTGGRPGTPVYPGAAVIFGDWLGANSTGQILGNTLDDNTIGAKIGINSTVNGVLADNTFNRNVDDVLIE